MSSEPSLTPDSLRYWLALLRAPLIGPRSFADILGRFGSPEAFFQAGRGEWQAAGIKSRTLEYLICPDWQRIDADMAWLEQPLNHCITLTDAAYPPLLLEMADPPPLLFVVGPPACLLHRHIAVVGSRNPSPVGLKAAAEFSANLVRAGYGIVSGLALGIDAASHQGALNAAGITIAVGGTGPDLVYPRSHRRLLDAILAQNGALLTEFPPGTQPVAGNFPRRNRIISGLSLGILVVEATPRSGSLITARLAAEQGREVFAIPGSIYNPLSRGCHDLIKDGAKLVQDVSDIVEEFEPGIFSGSPQPVLPVPQPAATGPHLRLLEHMGHEPTTVDALVHRSGESADQVTTMLVLLELEGWVASAAGGGYYRLG